jgi:hypothetical protein
VGCPPDFEHPGQISMAQLLKQEKRVGLSCIWLKNNLRQFISLCQTNLGPVQFYHRKWQRILKKMYEWMLDFLSSWKEIFIESILQIKLTMIEKNSSRI